MLVCNMKWTATFALAILLVVIAAVACGDDDDDGASNSSATPSESGEPTGSGDPSATVIPGGSGRPADSSYVFTIAEVGLGPDGWVRLENFSSESASLKGLFLCQPPECFEMPDVEVAGGESAYIAASDENDLESVAGTWTEMALTPSDGELGIYASESTDDPDEVRSYLQWGSSPHTGTETAIEAGFWVEGYAPSSENATRLFQNEGGLWLFDE